MNVVILMAGADKEFYDSGHRYPKNFVEINGNPIVEHVAQALLQLARDRSGVHFTFLVKEEEISRFHTDTVLSLLVPNAKVISVQKPTSGAACTALLAIDTIDADEPLLLCNGDMIVDADLRSIIADFENRDLHGGIVVFEAVHPRWSYVKTDADGFVIETAEKRPISKLATAGFYYFRYGRDFVHAAMDMIRKDAQVDGSFYVCPAYNELILRQKRIGIYEVPRTQYHSLADPRSVSDYEEFLRRQRANHAN